MISIIAAEQAAGTLKGVIVQLGGQTPLKIAAALEAEQIPILGTSPAAIDLAEDRAQFQQLIQRLELKQPENGVAYSLEQAREVAMQIGLPIVIRPSYVLGGRAMEVVYEFADLDKYMREAVGVSGGVSGHNPVLIDQFLQNAVEVDVDAICDGSGESENVFVAGIMEHIEEAGIHSGDSACILPPQNLSDKVLDILRAQTRALAHGLGVVGLMNVQFAVKDEEVYLLEVNPRASRTVPFVAKATGIPVAKIAARVMAGEKLKDLIMEIYEKDEDKDLAEPVQAMFESAFAEDQLISFLLNRTQNHVAVKEAVFPFARFPGVDVFLGPEMKSTGEVMGIDRDFGRAFAKSQLAAGVDLPLAGTVFVSVKTADKKAFIPICRELVQMGFNILATSGTASYLEAAGVLAQPINKVSEGRPHAVDAMRSGEIQLVFNTAHGAASIKDSFSLRQTALSAGIPYYTTASGSKAAMDAIKSMKHDNRHVKSLQQRFLEH